MVSCITKQEGQAVDFCMDIFAPCCGLVLGIYVIFENGLGVGSLWRFHARVRNDKSLLPNDILVLGYCWNCT